MRDAVRGDAGDVHAADPDDSTARPEEAGDRRQRRGLARAIAADERDRVARFDREVDAL